MRHPAFLLAFAALTAALVGCGGDTTLPPEDLTRRDAGPDVPRIVTRDVPATQDTGVDVPRNTNPVVVGVVPDHGPFAGGNEVVIRGSNFDEGIEARFADGLVQPRDTVVTDSRRLTVRPPAGRPGMADVAVELNGRRAVLPGAYRYDSIYADPGDGSIAGGTRITVHGMGTHFSGATTVTLDGASCVDVQVSSPERLSCTTPPHPEGFAALAVETGDERIRVEDAYRYIDNPESTRGGLGGGPIEGSLNVTVLAGATGAGIPNALVYLGDNPGVAAPRSARTNDRGRATLSFDGLRGPTTLTITAECFNSHTVQVFDARNVTLYLYAQMIPACARMGDPGSGPGPSGGTFGASVAGELIWDGPYEFAPNPWSNVPMPRAGEQRIAFVFATQTDIFSSPQSMSEGGVVLEVVTPGYGGRGYPFAITTRPSALAIYAIAGVEDIRTRRFTPYIMGVARGVLGSPRARITNVLVPMNIPLDHVTPVEVRELPTQSRGEPNRLRVEGFVDLGGEGVIARPDISVFGRGEDETYRLVAMPAFTGALADARLIVRAIYGTGEYLSNPFSAQVVSGITTPDDPVRLRNWVGIPDVISPADSGRLGTDRAVRFELRGASPDMFYATLSADALYWQTYALGTERSFAYPDLSSVMGLRDLPAGQQLYLNITAFRTPGFNLNEFRYNFLSQLYWTAYSGRTLLFSR